MKKKILLSSILTIAICLCLIAGSTFALFTSTATVQVAVTAANVEVTAKIVENSLKTWSLGKTTENTPAGSFVNGGSADVGSDGSLVITNMTPGDVVKFDILVTNKSNVAVQYKIDALAQAVGDVKDLSDALIITAKVNNTSNVLQASNKTFTTGWLKSVDENGVNQFTTTTIEVTVEFPNGTAANDNPFKNAKTDITFTISAAQANGIDANGNYIETNS